MSATLRMVVVADDDEESGFAAWSLASRMDFWQKDLMILLEVLITWFLLRGRACRILRGRKMARVFRKPLSCPGANKSP